MDEHAYRQTLSTSIARPCPFEISILTRCAACKYAEKHNVAERENVACSNETSFQRCVELHDALRHSFAFALHRTHVDGPLPHGQMMRVQCGGLKALHFLLDGDAEVGDIAELVEHAQRQYGVWTDLPYARIVQWAAANYRHRKP